MATIKRGLLTTLGIWFLLGTANGVLVTMPIWWAYLNILVGLSAPVFGYLFGVRREIDLRQFGRFLVFVAGLSLIPYGLFVLNSPLQRWVKSSVSIRLVAFVVICTTAYVLTYRRIGVRSQAT